APRATRSAAALWRRARAAKSPFELECLQRGLLILEESLDALVQVLVPGMTAQDAVAVCTTAAARQGMTLDTATVTAGRSAAPLEAGAVVQLELAGRRRGYHAAVARLAVLGAPREADDAAHTALEDALAAVVRALRPGTTARDVHRAFAGAGASVSAHGIGLDARELPDVGSDVDDVIEADSVLAVTVSGPAGRLIETVWVSSQGPKTFNRTGPGLVVLD
ncbi:MAG: aminopeptidase P family protein, partial [Chloroflexi bacterium]|nr:aminopeptidase P family protein [Chloroflexota bacterium]